MTIRSVVVPTRDAFTRAFRKFFDVHSPKSRNSFARLLKIFQERAPQALEAYRVFKDVRNLFLSDDLSISSTDNKSKFLNNARVHFPEFFEKSSGVPQNETAFTLCFLLQTYVARVIFATLKAFCELDVDELKLFLGESIFDWSEEFDKQLQVAQSELDEIGFEGFALNNDPFDKIAQNVLPVEFRRKLGEFYTPSDVANYLIDGVLHFSDCKRPTFFDPTCGAGVFLTCAARRLLNEGLSAVETLSRLSGGDVSPLATLATRANILATIAARLDRRRRRDELLQIASERRTSRPKEEVVDVAMWDAISERSLSPSRKNVRLWKNRRFDVVLGNPPWLAWEKLSREYRRKTRKYWSEFGLFDLGAYDARFGGGKKELATLVFYATISRRLVSGGTFAFVLPRSLFLQGKASSSFRAFGAGTSHSFAALEIDDFSGLNLFSGASRFVSALIGRTNDATRFPIALRRWELNANFDAFPDVRSQRLGRALGAQVVEGLVTKNPRDKLAPFTFLTANAVDSRDGSHFFSNSRQNELVEALFDSARLNPPSTQYRAQLGANAAGASGVYWVEPLEPLNAQSFRDGGTALVRNLKDSGKRQVEQIEARVEVELLHPLLRWRDVSEYKVQAPTTFILVPQNPATRRGWDRETMETKYPSALEYLTQFETSLRERAAYKRYQSGAPFWSLYNVDRSTFAPRKVVWKRMDSQLRAALVLPDARFERPVVPQETLSMVVVNTEEEGDYLCALLNSEVARYAFENANESRSKSFGSPGALNTIPIPPFDASNPLCAELASIGATIRKSGENIND